MRNTRWILVTSVLAGLALIVVGTGGAAWAAQATSTHTGIHAAVAQGEPQPGDDRGGHGRDDKVLAKGEPQPGDDRGGHRRDHKILAKGEPQPGDDRGQDLAKGEPQPGDDRGHDRAKGEPQPGDDRGGHGRDG